MGVVAYQIYIAMPDVHGPRGSGETLPRSSMPTTLACYGTYYKKKPTTVTSAP